MLKAICSDDSGSSLKLKQEGHIVWTVSVRYFKKYQLTSDTQQLSTILTYWSLCHVSPQEKPDFPSRGTSFERQISRLIFEFGQGLDGMKDGVLREIGCQGGKDVETCDKKRVIFCFDSEQSLVGRIFN